MSFGFGLSLPAYPLRGGGGNNPFNQLGPTLDLSFAGTVTDLSNPNGYTLNTNFITPQYQIAAQYLVWELGVGLVDKTFSQIITFTRASTATYFDSAGVLQSAAIDVPRFDYNPATLAAQGLLIEEQRTNSLQRSEEFNDAYWTKGNSSITANATTSPSNTLTGDKLVEDATNNTHRAAAIISVTSGTVYTLSVFAKAAERSALQLGFGADASAFPLTQAIFSLTGAGSFTNVNGTPNAVITSVGNGWYRCSISATASATTASAVIRYFLCNGTTAGSDTYLGDGTSGLFIWGAQLEAGAFPTSYIPTTTTALTRSADVASVNTLSPWYNSTAGTLYFEGVSFDTTSGVFPRAYQFNDGTNNNVIQITRNNSSGNARMSVVLGGATQAAADATAWTLNATTKAALAYATNDFAIVANGGAATTDTSGTVPTVTNLLLGSQFGGVSQINGYLRRITYYPRRLSNAELQTLTT